MRVQRALLCFFFFYDIFSSEHKKETIESVGSGNLVWYRFVVTSDVKKLGPNVHITFEMIKIKFLW